MPQRLDRALPDYNSGIVNLQRSVIAACGESPGDTYAELAALPSAELRGCRHVVVLVIDGLGFRYVTDKGAGGVLASHLRARLSSVFPSTTASAVTSFLTGVAPRQHAVTGWFMRLERDGQVIAPLPFTTRLEDIALEGCGVAPEAVFHCEGLFAQLNVRTHLVYPAHLLDTVYSRKHRARAQPHGFVSLSGLFATLGELLKARERSYTFAYWPEFDSLSHRYGNGSANVHAHFAVLERELERFLQRAEGLGVALVVTADHGFVDVAPETCVHLDDHPELARTLSAPLCGEPRAAYCYIENGAGDDFETYVRERLASCCAVERSEALVANNFFGIGDTNPALLSRIGDYTLLMKDRFVIKDRIGAEEPGFPHVGVHGGLSADEMHVPLVVAVA